MDKVFFGHQIDRLKRVYSQNSLPQERVEILWGQFKTVENRVFESAINHMIGEYTSPALPGISRFKEAMHASTPKGYQVEGFKELPNGFKCIPCRDFGFVWEAHLIVRCKLCATGKQIGDSYIAKQQGNYDRGRKLLKEGKFNFGSPPYDPNEFVIPC